VAPQGARGQIEALLADASRSIDIYAEEIADSRLEAELAGLAHRGVRVRVLIPPSARNAAVSSLVSGGVQVRTSSRPYIHAKAVVVDNREGFVGSENVSATSLDHNRELGILIRGTPLRTIADYFETDWVSARPVT
jgi:phosphatidylserine/phosphatidylglycerophosphate/cardiolipin synthase-like enzyme